MLPPSTCISIYCIYTHKRTPTESITVDENSHLEYLNFHFCVYKYLCDCRLFAALFKRVLFLKKIPHHKQQQHQQNSIIRSATESSKTAPSRRLPTIILLFHFSCDFFFHRSFHFVSYKIYDERKLYATIDPTFLFCMCYGGPRSTPIILQASKLNREKKKKKNS